MGDLGCPALHLAIEVDDKSHAGEVAQEYDAVRQSEIQSLGARFIRVSNDDVTRNALDVADGIALVVAEMKEEFVLRANRLSMILIAKPQPAKGVHHES